MRFSAEQLEARRLTLNASEVRPLMTMNVKELMQLWRIKTGRELPEDLSGVWAVGVGSDTEQRHLDWHEVPHEVLVTRRGERIVHPRHPMFACTLDGWLEPPGCPLEVKHCGNNEPLEVQQQRYMPQLYWQMMCCNVTQAYLSIARCLADPVAEKFTMDHSYAAELIKRALQFWDFVLRDVEPIILPPAPPPISDWKEYNMVGNDRWRRFAQQWRQTRGAAQSCDEASKVLKSLVPADGRKCFGDGVVITRDRTGRLFLRADIPDQVEFA